jgi:hypothetical protein
VNAKLVFALWTMFCVSAEAQVAVRVESSSIPFGWTNYCYPPWGGQYASTITPEMRDSSPDWTDDAQNPPLSARKALTLAEATLRATQKVNIDPLLERELVGVRLIPLDGKKWCWEVSYEWHRHSGGESGIPYSFRVFVLMNGKTVEPEAREWTGAEIEINKSVREKEKSEGGQDSKTPENGRTAASKATPTPNTNHPTALVVVSSSGGETDENEFLVMRATGNAILWSYIRPEGFTENGVNPVGKIEETGTAAGNAELLKKAFNATLGEITDKTQPPRKETQRIPRRFSLLLIDESGVKTCQLWSGKQRRRLVHGEELKALFSDVRKLVFGLGQDMSDLLQVGINPDLAEPRIPIQYGPEWQVPKIPTEKEGKQKTPEETNLNKGRSPSYPPPPTPNDGPIRRPGHKTPNRSE